MRKAILTALLATAGFAGTAATARAQCQPIVTRNDTFHEGLFCSYWTYCYTVSVPRGCKVGDSVYTFCVTFKGGTGQLRTSTITKPLGWTATVTATQICWSTPFLASSIKPGTSKTFCVDTKCNATYVEGIQDWKTTSPNGVRKGRTRFGAASGATSRLHGLRHASIGMPAQLAATKPTGSYSISLLYAAQAQGKVHIPGIGLYLLDPRSSLLLAPMKYDAQGRSVLMFLVPNDRRLIGLDAQLQIVDVLPLLALSNRWSVKIG